VLITTRYSSAPEAVNAPFIEEDVIDEKFIAVGCADGGTHTGKVVVWLPVSAVAVKYNGPPEHAELLNE
jgi:hypothetical protein